MNSRLPFRASPRLAAALLALVAAGALSPVLACGGSDDDGSGGTADSGSGDGSTGLDSGANDATTGDSGASSFDAATDSPVRALDAATDAGSADGALSDADAASGACKPINGVYTLAGPASGSTAVLCPTESGITCHFATESGSCELVTQCSTPDGGLGTGFFAIPTGTLDGNDRLDYQATYAVPVVGTLVASCALQFSSGATPTATLTCAGSVQGLGTLASCAYSGGLSDGGL